MNQLIYTLDDLDAQPVGTVVHSHRDLPGPGQHAVLARQPGGWYGAWDNDLPVHEGLVIPCTVLHHVTQRGVRPA